MNRKTFLQKRINEGFKNTSTDGMITYAKEKSAFDYTMEGKSEQESTGGKNHYVNAENLHFNTVNVSGGAEDLATYDGYSNVIHIKQSVSWCTTKNNVMSPDFNSIAQPGQKVTVLLLMKTNYACSLYYGTNGGGVYVALKKYKDVSNGWAYYYATYTFSSSATSFQPNFHIQTNGEAYIAKLQVSLGDTVIDFEPYTGGQPSPSPDYPQEIKSVGDKTENLFDGSKYNGLVKNEDGTYKSTKYYTASTAVTFKGKPNTQYTISFRINGELNGVHTAVSINGTWINTVGGTGRFTTDNNGNADIKIGGSSYQTIGLANWNIQINEGTTAQPYEPYGYKIPVEIKGKNLFDGIFANGGYDPTTGSPIPTQPDRIYAPTKIKVDPNTTYKMIFKNPGAVYELEYDKNQTYLNLYPQVMYHTTSGTFTTRANTEYIAFYYIPYQHSVNLNEQCLLKETSIGDDSYEPYFNETTNIYLDEPLRSIGNVADKINFITKKRNNLIGNIVLNGSEAIYDDWQRPGEEYADYIIFYLRSTILDGNYKDGTHGLLCNYFTSNGSSIWNHIGTAVAINPDRTYTLQFKMLRSFISNKDLFKQWLSTHNTEVQYELETPTEETINLPQLPLHKGTNIITIGTEVQPYSTEIIYRTSILPTQINNLYKYSDMVSGNFVNGQDTADDTRCRTDITKPITIKPNTSYTITSSVSGKVVFCMYNGSQYSGWTTEHEFQANVPLTRSSIMINNAMRIVLNTDLTSAKNAAVTIVEN